MILERLEEQQGDRKDGKVATIRPLGAPDEKRAPRHPREGPATVSKLDVLNSQLAVCFSLNIRSHIVQYLIDIALSLLIAIFNLVALCLHISYLVSQNLIGFCILISMMLALE